MRVFVRRHRRIVGRSGEPRFHRHAPAGGGGGTVRRRLLAGAPERHGQFERGEDALADFEPAVLAQSFRSTGARPAGVGRRPVPLARLRAGAVEHRP